MSELDLGTVRLYERDGILDVHFAYGDEIAREAVRLYKGQWARERRCWRIDPTRTHKSLEEIVAGIGSAVLEGAPEGWRRALPSFSRLCATTRRFELRFGAGGVRVGLPAGHKHEWTFKKIDGVMRDGRSWLVPAGICDRGEIKTIFQDVLRDDRSALVKILDYLDGFTLSGGLALADGEEEAIGLAEGAVVGANGAFMREVDKMFRDSPDPIDLYPMRVLSIAAREEESGAVPVRLAFVTGEEAYGHLSRIHSPATSSSPVLDQPHVTGKWVRRRG